MTSERPKRRDFLSLIFISKSISKKLLINTGFVTVLCNGNVHVFTSPIFPLILTFGKLIKEPNFIGTLKKPLFSLFDLHYYFF